MSRDRLVACLCAEWCGVCREVRPLFDRLAEVHPQVRFEWIDIEDEAELMGEVDVDTFPTLLVVDGGEPTFFGAVLPRAEAFATALRSASAGAPIRDEAVAALARRLHARA
jgi:thiol-disulfide isomerase/thioredoxin